MSWLPWAVVVAIGVVRELILHERAYARSQWRDCKRLMVDLRPRGLRQRGIEYARRRRLRLIEGREVRP